MLVNNIYLIPLFTLLSLVRGSVINLTATPGQVLKGLTPSLVLRCSLNDTAASAAIVGRRDVTETADNVEELTSLVVMLNGQDVASISHNHPATSLHNSSNLHTTGDVSRKSGERGFIELTYSDPSQDQVGEYTCEANGISTVGHGIVFSRSMEVGISSPTIQDVIQHFHQADMKNQLQISQLEERVKQLENTESGYVECHNDKSWSGSGMNVNSRTTDVIVNFQRAYLDIPTITVGVAKLDTDSSVNTRFHVTVVNASKAGFTVRCETWSDTHVYHVGVNWISVAI